MGAMNTKRYIQVIFLFLFIATVGHAESFFSPLVRNFSTADEGAGRQNWSLAQDNDGVMFIANSNCLLEFDGYTWRKHILPHVARVRSVAIDDHGRIFVGSFREFGWFDKQSDGSLSYVSISDRCAKGDISNDDIWNIVFNEGKVYFQSFENLFIYDGKNVETVKISLLNITCIDGILYGQLLNGKVAVLSNDGEIEGICNPTSPENIYIASIFPLGDGRVLMASTNNGLFVYDPENSSFKQFKTEFDEELNNWNANRGIRTKDGNFVLGSSANGLISFNKEGLLLWRMNREKALLNETVLGLLCDNSGNIWASLDDGIALILSQSEFSVFQSQDGKMGMAYDILPDEDITYIGTNKGLYSLSKKGLKEIAQIKGQTWYAERFDNDIFIGNNYATYRISDGTFKQDLANTGSICIKEVYLADNKRHLLEGTYIGIRRYDKNPDSGEWEFAGYIPNSALARNVEIDSGFHIWYENMNMGIFRITLSSDLNEVTETLSFPELSEIGDGGCHLLKINGRIVLSNGDGFLTYDDMQDKIVPYVNLNEAIGHIKGVHQAARGDGTTYWVVGDRNIAQLDCSTGKYKIIREIPLSIFGEGLEDRSSLVYDSATGYAYLCLNNKIVRVGKASSLHENLAPLSLLEVKYSSSRGKSHTIGNPIRVTTARGCNNLRFTLRFPEYNDFGTILQYRLYGLEDTWRTVNSSGLEQTFERLKFRRYHYQARILNTSGDVLESLDIPVKVRPDWQYSRLMILIYIFSAACLFILIGKRTKKHHIELLDLEGRMDDAINEKRDIEARLKTKESELAQMAVNGMSSDSHNWELFKQNFDCLEEHFFTTLSDKYPDLTTSDLKFCALLRLNMSTKEIASALNLTTRGVESARYRLRKKFSLEPTDSLTTFIHKIK